MSVEGGEGRMRIKNERSNGKQNNQFQIESQERKRNETAVELSRMRE